MAPDVHLLGQVRVQNEAGTHRPPLDMRLGLLAYLACVDDWVARDRLAFLFWPDVPDTRARTNLRSLLGRLRRLPGSEGLEVEPRHVRWRGGSDVRAFRESLAAKAWWRAVAWYGGELLPGADFAEVGELGRWLAEEREGLRQGYRRALLAWCEHVVLGDEAQDAVRRLEALVAEDPFDEGAARRAMELLAANGDRRRALRLGHALRSHLADELEARPSDATERLLERLEGGEEGRRSGADAVSRVEDAGGRHLPSSLTPFIARERERHEIAERIVREECRLLTITGVGGVGKTRLALRVAADVGHRYRDGPRFVPLGVSRSIQEVAAAVAEALGVALPGSEEADKALPWALRDRHALLVLDDLYAHVEPARFVSELLTRCSGIDLLVTARERLDIAEEWLYPLAGLSWPHQDEEADAMHRAGAPRLFLDAAQRVEPRLRLEQRDLPHVARICRIVEGLPLAVELAAAWVRALPLGELADELEGNLDMLRRTPRGDGDRHQSVYAALEHSWARLEDWEAEAFAMLSVFRGGFRRDAATEVADVGVAELAALVDRSLLRRSPEGRYDFHPLVAHYARAKLAERPEAERSARLRHRDHYARWIREVGRSLERKGTPGVARRVATEYANVRAALDGALRDGDAERATIIGQSLAGFWLWDGRVREGRALSEDLLRHVPRDQGRARTRALLTCAETTMMQGEVERAATAYREAHAIVHESGDRELEISALNGLGFTALHAGRHEESRASFERGLALAEGEEHAELRTLLLVNLGALGVRAGDASLAREALERTRALCASIGNIKKAGLATLHLARLERKLGRHEEASHQLEEALDTVSRAEHSELVARVHLHIALSARLEGDAVPARSHLHEALTVWWEAGATGRVADVLRVAAALHADEGRHGEAQDLWDVAEQAQPSAVSMLFPSELRPLANAVTRHEEAADLAAGQKGSSRSPGVTSSRADASSRAPSASASGLGHGSGLASVVASVRARLGS